MFDGLNARLDQMIKEGVDVNLSFSMKDYAYMGFWIFAGLFAALVLAHVVTKRL